MASRKTRIRTVLLRSGIGVLALRSALSFSLFCASAQAVTGETLAQVKSRGALHCGVGEDSPGFASKDSTGHWTGFDVDFCRAVAAAIFGDAGKVTFIPLRASERFPALQARSIDLLVRQTTWTLLREEDLKVLFAGVLLYDGQGFLVPAGIKSPAQLKGSVVCVVKETTSGQNLADYSAVNALDIKALVSESMNQALEELFAGSCQALTSDASQLAAARLRAPGGAGAYVILPERIAKEPLGPAVRSGDDDWFTLVRWVLFTLIGAEDADLTRENVTHHLSDPRARQVLGTGEHFGQALGIDDDWPLWVVRSVGNYGEIFERNLGRGSPLKIERGANRLWSQGGLMYAPPFR
ncbi:MAG TPA: amino acid ABC transporter substrate-binding protein [Burkholderiaceae bacterium]|nr:amino acid ABC transporter substrate-binding protein [Burkholderiaceae bacterium]